MATNYPTSLDSYAALVDNTDGIVAAHPNNRGDAIEALEAKVGIDSSAVTTSHDYKLTHLPAQVQNLDIGAYELRAQTLEADVTTGTAPLTIASTTVVSNLNVDQVDGKDSTDFVLCDGTQALTANWDVGAYTITGTRFISDISTGTSPFACTSTTVVTNLNADTVDGKDVDGSNGAGEITTNDGTQTLTNKTLTAPDINGGTVDAITSLTVANSVDIGAFELRAATLEADIATGTAPLTIASTTKVSNLNADKWDGEDYPMTTRGDIMYHGASAATRLAKGTSGQVLGIGANDPAWVTRGQVDSGNYAGNSTAAREITVNFTPLAVHIIGGSYSYDIIGAGNQYQSGGSQAAFSANGTLGTNKFIVGGDAGGANATGTTYYWVAYA